MENRDGRGCGAGVEMAIARGNGGEGFPLYSQTERETLGRTACVVPLRREEVKLSPLAFRKVARGSGVVEEAIQGEGGSLEVRVVIRRGVENYQVECGDFARKVST